MKEAKEEQTLEKTNEKRIAGLLTEMRNPKNGHSLFQDCLSEMWEALGLTDDKNLVSLEALLIEAVVNITIHKKITSNDCKANAQKRDAYLMSLGLLKGYYHTNENGTHYIVSERHKKYLSKSDYMALCSNLKPNDNININDPQSKPRRNISKDDERCRTYLGDYLSDKSVCQKCLTEGLKNHTQEVKSDDRTDLKIKLPEPIYTLENFPPIIEDKPKEMVLPEQAVEPIDADHEGSSANIDTGTDTGTGTGNTPPKKPRKELITYIINIGINFFLNKIKLNKKVFIVLLPVSIVLFSLGGAILGHVYVLTRNFAQKVSNNSPEIKNESNNSSNVVQPSDPSDSSNMIVENNPRTIGESQNTPENMPEDAPKSVITNGLDNLLDDVGNLQLSPGETFTMDSTYKSNDKTISWHVEIDSGLSANFDETPSKRNKISENSN